MEQPLFTLAQVLEVLRNVGCDPSCGACMSVAFTGTGTGEHTCSKADDAARPCDNPWCDASCPQCDFYYST